MENQSGSCGHGSCQMGGGHEHMPSHPHHHMHGKCCSQSESCGCDSASPGERATKKWICAFHKALWIAHVEVLKAKILEAWGSKLDQSADAVLEAMESKWEAVMEKEQVKMDLAERLAEIMKKSKK